MDRKFKNLKYFNYTDETIQDRLGEYYYEAIELAYEFIENVKEFDEIIKTKSNPKFHKLINTYTALKDTISSNAMNGEYTTMTKLLRINKGKEIETPNKTQNEIHKYYLVSDAISVSTPSLTLENIIESHNYFCDSYNAKGLKNEPNIIFNIKTNQASFYPPLPEDSKEYFRLIIDNFNHHTADEIDEDVILQIIFFVCDFGNIHPFADGNGRTGRLLYRWLLLLKKVGAFKYASFDTMLYEERIAYQRVLNEASKRWYDDIPIISDYVLFILNRLIEGSRIAIESIKSDVWDDDLTYIIYDIFMENISSDEFSIEEILKFSDNRFDFYQVQEILNKLVTANILSYRGNGKYSKYSAEEI